MGSKEQDVLLDLVIKRMTSSSLRVVNESKWAEHIEAGSECGLEPCIKFSANELDLLHKEVPDVIR